MSDDVVQPLGKWPQQKKRFRASFDPAKQREYYARAKELAKEILARKGSGSAGEEAQK